MARCTAKARRTGEQCRRDAIKGGTVCISHGGAAPQVRAAAQARFAEARDRSLAKYVQQVDSDLAPAAVTGAMARDYAKLVMEYEQHKASAESGSAVDDYLESLKDKQ